MPLPISLAHRLAKRLADVRKAEVVTYLRPDGKTQVSVRYRDGKPVEIEKLLISTQHKEGAESLIPDDLWEHVVEPILPEGPLRREEAAQELPRQPDGPVRHRRPGGRRGPDRPQDHRRHLRRHGPPRRRRVLGKDPSKVDRSAAYAARYVAKNIVAAGLADRCEVQVAYAIGVAHPVSVMVETFGTEKIGRGHDRPARRRALRPPSGRVPRVAQAAPSHLPEDRGVRPLRP
jgi:S-adenosylmethionine synthetase